MGKSGKLRTIVIVEAKESMHKGCLFSVLQSRYTYRKSFKGVHTLAHYYFIWETIPIVNNSCLVQCVQFRGPITN